MCFKVALFLKMCFKVALFLCQLSESRTARSLLRFSPIILHAIDWIREAFVGVSKFTRASGDETKSQCNKSTFLNRAPLACAQANLFFWPHLSAAKMPGLLAPACPCPISSRFVDSDGEVIFEIFLNLDLAF
jgi:hypothetical protein